MFAVKNVMVFLPTAIFFDDITQFSKLALREEVIAGPQALDAPHRLIVYESLQLV